MINKFVVNTVNIVSYIILALLYYFERSYIWIWCRNIYRSSKI